MCIYVTVLHMTSNSGHSVHVRILRVYSQIRILFITNFISDMCMLLSLIYTYTVHVYTHTHMHGVECTFIHVYV